MVSNSSPAEGAEQSATTQVASRTIVWVGRLTGPKGEIARKLAFEVFPKLVNTRCLLVGGPAVPADWPTPAAHIQFLGQTSDVSAYYQQADLVLGAGRVALEAMRLGKPVMAVGECCYVGLVDQERVDLAKATNFGDCYAPANIDWARLSDDLLSLESKHLQQAVSHYPDYLRDYAGDHVQQEVRKVYRQAQVEAGLRHLKELPVLMYHRVTTGPVDGSRHNVFVTVERLREQLQSLKRRGYQAVTFKELADGKRVRKPVILTFDDGYVDNHDNLLPLLQEFGFKAVIFALADPELQRNEWDIPGGEPPAPLMNREQLLACHRSGLIEIASHGLSHAHLPELSDDELRRELVESKAYLEDLIGEEVVSFAYPYGDCSERETRAAQQAGYLFGVATVSGPLHLCDDYYRIRRINLMPKDRGMTFWKKTSGFYLRYCRWKGKDF